jgi:hypothetical protein
MSEQEWNNIFEAMMSEYLVPIPEDFQEETLYFTEASQL